MMYSVKLCIMLSSRFFRQSYTVYSDLGTSLEQCKQSVAVQVNEVEVRNGGIQVLD